MRKSELPERFLGWSAEISACDKAVGVPQSGARNWLMQRTVDDSPMSCVQRALETAGIEFIDENGGGPGVRLRRRQRAKKAR